MVLESSNRERERGEEGREGGEETGRMIYHKYVQLKSKNRAKQGQREEIYYVNCSFQQYTSANTCTCSV